MPDFSKRLSAFAVAAAVALAAPAFSAHAAALLSDDFGGMSIDKTIWNLPKSEAAADGTYVGRTQFRGGDKAALPPVSAGSVCLELQTFNPRHASFYGTELISNREFTVGKGLDITVRARLKNADYHGVVGGLFLYSLNPGSNTIHDEIDFELLTNLPDKVQTNIYANEPLGPGHVELIPYKSGSVDTFHTYEIKWLPNRVSWLVDGDVIRTTTSNIPTRPMNFYLNIWAPDRYWAQGFSASIQPSDSQASNVVLNSLCVASVTIKAMKP